MRAKKSPDETARPSATARRGARADLLTPNQVADRLLVAPVTVRLWASRGLLRSETTPGGHRRFREQDVADFIARRREMQEPNRGPSRMLIIDDDAEYARSLARMLALQAPSLHIEMAHDGFAAGIKCEALRPDIVTLDLHMPDMNGFEVCRLLRSMFGRERPRIVVLSGLLSEESQRRVLEAGADACVSKSAPAATLLQELGIASQNAAKLPG
jgi:excisionase family DNA binding protein